MDHEESLSFITAQKMIDKLLLCERIEKDIIDYKAEPYNKQQLSKKLFLSTKQLGEFGDEDFYKRYSRKISLPLIKLFCATKFYEDY
jgi:hypothetical protein